MAGLRIYQSNRLERLVDGLAGVLSRPLASPLAAEVVVVQSRGMERWLKLELAKRLGVWANMRFPFPKAFTREVFQAVLPGLPAKGAFDREVLEWRIMDLLPRLAESGGHAEIQRYLGDGRDGRKRFQLAARLANLFDQYLVFRRDTLRGWTGGGDAEDWQAALWRELGGGALPRHPAFLMAEFAAAVAEAETPALARSAVGGARRSAALPERVCLFGLSALPPFYLEVFAALAARVDVQVFVLQPSREYWGHIRTRREQHRALRRAGQPSDAADAFHLEEGNRLLASLGRLGREFLDLLLEREPVEEREDFVPPGEDSVLHRVQSDILHLRSRGGGAGEAQAGRESASEQPAAGIEHPAASSLAPGDRSLQVHSCHSPLREVEVLHDHLLEWFQTEPDLTPRDVLVMTPDIEVYAPLAQAVFGAPEQEALRIPFSVADRSPRQEGRLTEAFLSVLRLAGSRLTAPAVLALLDAPAVRARFGLAQSDLERVRHWVREAGIRWGRDAAHRARLGLPPLPENTWEFGLDRLLLGYAMAGEELVEVGVAPASSPGADGANLGSAEPAVRSGSGEGRGETWLNSAFTPGATEPPGRSSVAGPPPPWPGAAAGASHTAALHPPVQGNGQPSDTGHEPPRSESAPRRIAPFAGIEGAQAEVLGGFAEFLSKLFATLDELERPRPLAEWSARLLRVLGDFFAPGEDDAAEARFLRERAEALARHARQAGFSEPVELAVVLEPLARALEDAETSGAGFLTGGVTFCALKPMRSLPFRVVCLLGMNDEAFPRRAQPLSFDLMARERRPGDRSVRDDDRYLFLETLLSARERLYISYVGQSQRDAAETPPSVVVSELLDYVAQGFTLPGGNAVTDLILTKHRLQAFSPAYFESGDARLFSFSLENAAACASRLRVAAARPFLETPLAAPEPEFLAVGLRELKEFFVNPCRALLRRRLKLRLPEEAAPLEESEPFEVGGLTGFDVRQTLVAARLAGRAPAAELARLRAVGGLPLGEAGRALAQQQADAAEEFFATLTTHVGDGWREPVDVDLAVPRPAGEFRLTGRVEPLGGRGLLGWRCAKLKAKDLVRHWIQHLALNAVRPAGVPLASTLVAQDKTFAFAPVTDAERVLGALLERYWHGLCQPLKFFPETSLAFVKAERSERARRQPIEAARASWEPGEFVKGAADSEDPHIKLCFRDADPLDAEFEREARDFFGPLLDAAREAKA